MNEDIVKVEEKTEEVKLSKLTQTLLRHDQNKAAKAAAKANLTEDEKKALKKSRRRKIIGGVGLVAATAVGTLIAVGSKSKSSGEDTDEVVEINETSDEESEETVEE